MISPQSSLQNTVLLQERRHPIAVKAMSVSKNKLSLFCKNIPSMVMPFVVLD
jgi:hypothetical protein